jgi:hypothetical protein
MVRFRTFLAGMALVALWAGTVAMAQEIRVVLDGEVLAFDVPPVEIQGRVLVPLRGIFERLQAYVEFDEATRTIHARRGTVAIRLQLGSRTAYINDRPTTLDVPAMAIRGRTMVPLRFVSEALGAMVEWDGATRTVVITTGAAAPRPTPRAAAQPSVIEGVLLGVNVERNRITVARENVAYTITVTPDTAITRINVDTNTGGSVSLGELRRGDQVRVTVDAQSRAIAIRATYRVVSGRIEALTARLVVLEGGDAYRFAPDVDVRIDGRPGEISDLRPGMTVALRLNPQTNEVWGVEARRTAQLPTPPAPGQVVVSRFEVSPREPLRAGETLTVTLVGTPGGRATFSIGDTIRDVPMTERQPGVYVGTFTVRPGDDVTNAPVFGRLAVGNVVSPLVQSAAPVTIDTRPPRIVEMAPAAGARVPNNRPTIVVVADDGAGSGIRGFRLFVRGREVTQEATQSDRILTYTPPQPLPDGRVEVRVQVVDRAGNSAEREWSFLVDTRGAAVRSVTFSPTRPLVAGDVLLVVVVAEPGGRASFTIEGIAENIPMAEQQPGRYVGTYTVRAGDVAPGARVIVQFVRPTGEVVRAVATGEVIIAAARPGRPVIERPRPGERVRSPLVVRGRATPGFRVRVVASFESVLGPVALRGRLGEAEVTADAGGRWEVTIRFPLILQGARITITAVAVSPTGQESDPVMVNVFQE